MKLASVGFEPTTPDVMSVGLFRTELTGMETGTNVSYTKFLQKLFQLSVIEIR